MCLPSNNGEIIPNNAMYSIGTHSEVLTEARALEIMNGVEYK